MVKGNPLLKDTTEHLCNNDTLLCPKYAFLVINVLPKMRTPLYTGHFTRSKVSIIEGFHCIKDTSPGPQGVHNRGVPLYTGHFTRSPSCTQ